MAGSGSSHDQWEPKKAPVDFPTCSVGGSFPASSPAFAVARALVGGHSDWVMAKKVERGFMYLWPFVLLTMVCSIHLPFGDFIWCLEFFGYSGY
jgi:hypothetical protein